MFAQVDEAAGAIRRRYKEPPVTAVVLGSGLGAVASGVEDRVEIPYAEIPHWPVPAVAGHAGRLVLGTVDGRPVAMLAGRVHLYEGHGLDDVVFGVRVMGRLGVREVVLTNAAGGIREDLMPGTLMIIDDHLNLLGTNPLIGPNDDRFGPRFPDMTEVYSRRLRTWAGAAARAAGVPIAHGVYAGVTGPSYETPAEVRALRALGADAVGSSTVAEAIAARHMGIDVLGISCIANAAAGLGPDRLSHTDVLRQMEDAAGRLAMLLASIAGKQAGG
jgi:purine-nucleoside phosphorylase